MVAGDHYSGRAPKTQPHRGFSSCQIRQIDQQIGFGAQTPRIVAPRGVMQVCGSRRASLATFDIANPRMLRPLVTRLAIFRPLPAPILKKKPPLFC